MPHNLPMIINLRHNSSSGAIVDKPNGVKILLRAYSCISTFSLNESVPTTDPGRVAVLSHARASAYELGTANAVAWLRAYAYWPANAVIKK